MYEYNDFHESYYNHSCSIVPERDVLNIDIEGTGCGARFSRWWHDLFLLSYTNERSRIFYTSSHAMRMERMRQFRKYRNRLHPLCKFRYFWDYLLLIVFVSNKLVFHFTSTCIYDELSMSLYYAGVIFDGIIIMDLFVSLKSGFINTDARRIVLDSKKSIMRFCTTKLFVYVVSAIPLHWIMFIRLGDDVSCGLCKSNRFFCALKAISVFSLYRVYETSAFLVKQRRCGVRSHICRFLRIGAVGCTTMFQYIDFSDMINLFCILRHGAVLDSTFFGQMIIMRYADDELAPNYSIASYDFSRICKSLLLFSYFQSRQDLYADKMTNIVAYALANVFYVWSLIECYSFVSRFKYIEDQFLCEKSRALNMLESRQLPDMLMSKVKQYFDFNLVKYRIIEIQNGLYRGLPVVLMREAFLHRYCHLLMRIPFFKEWPPAIVEDLVMMLVPEVYLKNDIVVDAWIQGSGLTVVDVGMLAVYTAQYQEVGHLIDGDYFGEVSLVTDKEVSMSYVVAITNCSVLVLRKGAFRKYMRQHPHLFFNMKQDLKNRYEPIAGSSESLLSASPGTRN